MKVGIAGAGAIGLASAAWLASRGHVVRVWAPRHRGPHALERGSLLCAGVLEGRYPVGCAADAASLCAGADVIVVAVPLNGHRAVMEALAPHLRAPQQVVVSSMGSLSSLFLRERLLAAGHDVTVASLGTTVLTARRRDAAAVQVMTRRRQMGVSALPTTRTAQAVQLMTALFGDGFVPEANALATALTNINPAAHGPLAVFNWTRIERAEAWPQYHYLTPRVAAVIERLDAERCALAAAFGLAVRSIEQHFARSFGTTATGLADIAAELHAERGGPPGPTDIGTRFLHEDMPFGLVFCDALGRVAGVPTPATRTLIDAASLVTGVDFDRGNDLLEPLALAAASRHSLLERVA